MPGDVVIRATGLTKRYGDNIAVDGIDFEVRAGEISVRTARARRRRS
jgi:ABC-type multidrug transport system ATPase subunit